MTILRTLIHVLAVAEGPGCKSVGAGALEAAVQVCAGAVAADPRTLNALVLVHALLAAAVQAITTRAVTPIKFMYKFRVFVVLGELATNLASTQWVRTTVKLSAQSLNRSDI